MKDRDPDMPLSKMTMTLIMASHRPEERGLPQDLPKIAGLNLHPREAGQEIASGSNVIYGVGEQ